VYVWYKCVSGDVYELHLFTLLWVNMFTGNIEVFVFPIIIYIYII
jgi:hypothetical protein